MQTLFLYRAYNHEGKEIHGEILANDKKDAFEKIRLQQWFPIEISTSEKKKLSSKKERPQLIFGSVDREDLARFTSSFALLYKSNIPLAMGLRILKNQRKSGLIRNALILAIPEIEAGTPISEALAKHPKAFDDVYVNTLRAGEASGAMASVLERLAQEIEKRNEMKSKLQEALIYPVISLLVGLGILVFFLWYVIPMINQFVRTMSGNKKQPWLTQQVLTMADFFRDYGSILAGIVCLIWLLYRFLLLFRRGRQYVDSLRLKIPLLGKLIYQQFMSGFCRTLSTLLQNGVPLDNALNVLQRTCANSYLKKCFQEIHQQVVLGFPLDFAFREHKIFDEITVNLISLGEQSGNLKEVLLTLAQHLDSEVDSFLKKFLKILSPLLMIGLGFFVLILGLAFLLPIFNLYQGMSYSS
ncbi:MAG: type II secretion system F family protein [Planctomycetota bacterium]